MGVLLCADAQGSGWGGFAMVSAARHAPAVQWRVPAQAKRHLWVALGVQGAAGLWVLGWLCVGAGLGAALWWRVVVGWVVWLLGCGAWVVWLRCQRSGTLAWNGTLWMWQPSDGGVPQVLTTSPEVVWDGQQLMLLKLSPPRAAGAAMWLWVAAKQPQAQGLQAARWGDLRRAVYSSAAVRAAEISL